MEQIFNRLAREQRGMSADLAGGQMRVTATENGESVLAGRAFDRRGAIATEGKARLDSIREKSRPRHATQLTPPEYGQRMDQDDDAPFDTARPADELEQRRSRARQGGGDLTRKEHSEMDDAPASRQLYAGDNVVRGPRVTPLPLADRLDMVVVGDGDDAHR